MGTIRVRPETRDRLNRISAERRMTVAELVDVLAVEADDRLLVDAMAAHYRELEAGAGAWEHHRVEIAAWDATVGDGFPPAR